MAGRKAERSRIKRSRRPFVCGVIPLRLLLSIVACVIVFKWYHVNLAMVTTATLPQLHDESASMSSTNYSTVKSEKWIVATSADDALKWSNNSGWRLVVICDEKIPEGLRLPNVVYLDQESQVLLGYQFNKFSALNRYVGHVAGYLFAIEHGAKAIYAVDVKQSTDSFSRVSLLATASIWGLVHSLNGTGSFFNSGKHFGCSSDTIAAEISYYTLCQTNTAVFAPAVFDRDHSAAEAACDNSAPAVTMGYASYAFITSSNSLFTESGFWAFLPFNKAEYNTVWNYVAQWLLWNTKYRLTVYWSGVDYVSQGRSGTIKNVVDLLARSKCEGFFVRCTFHVAQKIVDERLVGEDFFQAVVEWFAILMRSGYSFPLLTSVSTCTDRVRYQTRAPAMKVAVANSNESLTLYRKTCNRSTGFRPQYELFSSSLVPWKQFTDVMLVITFNAPHYAVIPYLEILYRRIFPRIVYCGPEMIPPGDENLKRYELFFVTYSVPDTYGFRGGLNYECAIKVARINFNVKGYLFISDDVLLFPSGMTKLLNHNVLYFEPSDVRVYDLRTSKECKVGKCDYSSPWMHLPKNRDKMSKALNFMHSTCIAASTALCKCTRKLTQLYGDFMHASAEIGDFFYVPLRMIGDFAMVADVFLENQVFLEFAVSTAVTCLTQPEEIQKITGRAIWDSNRGSPWMYFEEVSKSGMYLHPVKWSGLSNSEEHIKFYCQSVLPMLYPFSQQDLVE